MKRFLLTALLLLLPSVALASPPIEYTGVLRNAGVPFEGEISLTFYIYDGQAADAPIWTEEHESVSVNNGRFRNFGFRFPFRPPPTRSKMAGLRFPVSVFPKCLQVSWFPIVANSKTGKNPVRLKRAP